MWCLGPTKPNPVLAGALHFAECHKNRYLFNANRADIQHLVMQSHHSKRLLAMGYEEDVRLCSQLNTLDVVPVLVNDRVVCAKRQGKANSSSTATDGEDHRPKPMASPKPGGFKAA